jgi:uncharacterized membrane protein YoaK (UPF0700 family)
METQTQVGHACADFDPASDPTFSWWLVALLSTTAGACDVVGFLGLGGLFVAHITGNLVILAAHYVTGGFSQIGPLLSVPVFVIVLALVTGFFGGKEARAVIRGLLVLHWLLILGFLVLGVAFGPLKNPESVIAICCGMLGVAAMATQSAMVKLDLPGFPSTAVLTTNTVQLTIDLATLIRDKGQPDKLARARHRARVTLPAVAGFVAGCTAGAILELHFGLWALTLPATTAGLALLLGVLWSTRMA